MTGARELFDPGRFTVNAVKLLQTNIL